jgi:hypothetical protein
MVDDSRTAQSQHRASTWRKTALRIASACAIGIFLSFVMPHIIGPEYTSRKAARIAAPLVGAFYRSTIRDSKITVLLIDDKALADAGKTWPPPYDYYADVLANVANYHPSAVFIDLIFSSARSEDVMPLVAAIDTLSKQGTRVYLAGALDEDGSLSVRRELMHSSAKPVAVEYDPDELDHVVWNYPMTRFGAQKEHEGEAEAEAEAANAPHARSAALAIFEDLYHKVDDTDEPLALTWGLAPVEDGLQWTLKPKDKDLHAASGDTEHPPTTRHAATPPELYCNDSTRTVHLMAATMLHAAIPTHGKPACVFHHTLYQQEFLYPDESQAARYHGLLDGHVVMIGTAFGYSNDIVVSPIQGRIPGIYLHAMALDNLISRDGDYTKAVEFEPDADWLHLRAFALLLIGLIGVAGVMLIKEHVLEGWQDAYRQRCIRRARARERVRPPSAMRRRWYRVLDKLVDAARCIALKAAEIALSFLLLGILLVVGQKVFNVAYLAAMEVALYALVSEWLEWNSKLVEWFNKPEETS